MVNKWPLKSQELLPVKPDFDKYWIFLEILASLLPY